MPSMNPATAPSTGLDRWRYVRTGGSALFTAWRTRRRWTPNFRATPLIVPIPNSYSRRNCSNSSTFVLLSTPPLPLVQRKDGTPREKGGPNSVSKVGRHPIANSERESWRVMYPLSEVLLLLTCATIASCDDFDEIAAWGRHH